MHRVICPGSFDPLHNGHVEVVARAAALFDEVVVAVSTNPHKRYRFDAERRLALAQESFEGVAGVVVEPMGAGLLAEYAAQRGAVALVKGLRSGEDYEYEVPMATMNRHLTGVETVFLPGDPRFLHLSSTLVKEVQGLGGDVSGFVPAPVLRALQG
ncbi:MULTISPECIES: pantetheine-phosphate adenylyltransferase [Kocuria]|uniref:Phosphopantetheine adenylyltransferase n=1 Tax=Kocuria rosea subsp. polaris TaxID=136273 RepID=A0A0W8I7J6_KOCRO|nr:pantetheine-phosphate adenylyltransferase [Kocuria polaris]KUG55368.1 phosphopantetheine adenylyltransferase [Kocuria polaris]